MKILVMLLCAAGAASATPGITVKHIDGTTTAYSESQLQNAIDDPLTVCGDIIEIDPGAARHNVKQYWLRGPALAPSLGGPATPPSNAKDCASSGGKYITIRSSLAYQLTPGKRVGPADVASLAFVGLLPDLIPFGDGCIVFQTERAANYWRLQGLNISSNTGDCTQGGNALVRTTYAMFNGNGGLTQLAHFPNHITIDQCWIHGLDSYQVRDGIQLEGISIELLNSTIENIRAFTNESHAIVSVQGRGPMRIVNNKLSALSSVLFFGGVPSPTSRPIQDVEFSNNWLYRPYKWMDWYGPNDPTPTSPCPVDSDAHGATYQNTVAVTYWECQGVAPGTWTQLANVGAYNALVNARLPYYGKNVSEFKSATRWHIEGNLLDQNGNLNLAGQHGTCFNWSLVDKEHSTGSYMDVENNICQHAGWAFIQGGPNAGDPPLENNNGRPLHHILFRNNLFQHMGEDWRTQPSFGALTSGVPVNFDTDVGFAQLGHQWGDSITIDHQTFQSEYTRGDAQHNIGLRGDRDFAPAQPPVNYRITNNIFTAGLSPITSSRGSGYNGNAVVENSGPSMELANNGIVDNLGIGISAPWEFQATIYHCDPSFHDCPYTTAYNTYPPNCLGCLIKTTSQALFVGYPNDLRLQPTSPFKAAALDGKDLGADLNMVGWATAGAQAGTMAPYLAMKIRSVIPAATSVYVRFSSLDTSSCTVEARKYGFPLASPTATATVNTGDLDRTVTLTGLTADTKYGLKVTCAGSYYREDDFRTP